MTTEYRRLEDICAITMGQAPAGESYNDDGLGLPLIAGAGDFGPDFPKAKKFTSEPTKICAKGDIVMSIRATIGTKVLSDGVFCLGRGVAGLRPNAELDARYLWHWLSVVENALAAKGRGATFSQVSRGDIGELEVPLPPLDEQRRIAAILDKIDALHRKRKRALELLHGLTQSILLAMFGDPVGNENGWARPQLSEICNRLTVGVVVKPASYYQPNGIPAIRSLNIRENEFDTNDLVFVGDNDNNGTLAKSRIFENDVVIVRTGQPGKAAVVPRSLDGANAIDILIVTTDKRKLNPTYFCDLLNSNAGKAMVLENKRGQIQQHLNVSALKAARFPIPPLKMQLEYEAQSLRLQTQKARYVSSLAQMNELFSSLQHRAFSGQL